MAERITRRGIVMVFSDLFDEPEEVLTGLMHLRHRRHEVVVFHVLDRAEEEFPFQESTLFRGMEQMPELLTDPRSLRDGYLEQIAAVHDRAGARLPGAEHRLRPAADGSAAGRWRYRRTWRIAWRGRGNDYDPRRERGVGVSPSLAARG